MFPFIPSLLLVLFLASPALLTPSTSKELQVRGQRTTRDTKQDSIKVVISEGCVTQGDSSDVSQGGKELDLKPGSPLVLTHKIKLVPSGSASGSGLCDCEADFAALRERLERLEREVSSLREKCGGAEGGCCTSKESKGAGCSIKPEIDECPNECSDQGRCVNGKCVCFPGFSGPDCSESNCPGDCNDKGRCVNGQCVCDPGFTGPDCSQSGCPDNCNNRGRCVNGQCVCDAGFAGPSCLDESCPANCNNRGRCVNGQCVCNPGFTGPDCSKKACPNNCSDRGRCVNGKCVCDSGSTGADCSADSCPGNCNKRGRCVNGQCVCRPGFTGPDCSERACPDNCNNRGRCVNGNCVCDSGFTGPDCSETACPGNCNSRGRCVNGECVCDDGFNGPDCSERTCPNDCSDQGRCVDGKCVCDSGFTGDDCSENSCPGNCNSRGRCVNGQCVCDDGFTGDDCSVKACPNNCSNRGKCVNGKCVCDVGFAGPDCAAKGCPNNCNNKGRCIKGKCVCRRGFTGPDCSQCEDGMSGPNCDTAMSGVSQLSTRDITETSVTLLWTPPRVQYEMYYIAFTSQKESDQQINVQVEGSLTTFTQTGLAAGQEYTVSITGEIGGRRGAESSTEFMTLISGPSNLRVVKTTSTSAVVQWEQSQGEIDRYRLTIMPNDGAGRSQEMTIPAGQDSAHIQQLEAGRLYDIVLVAEKGTSQSEPATTQVTPGKTLPRVTMAALNLLVTSAPGQDVGNRDQEVHPSPEAQVFDLQRRAEAGSEADSVEVRGIEGPNKDSITSVTARTLPLVRRMMAINGTNSKVAERPILYRKPNVSGPFRFNTTRAVPGRRKVGHGPLKKLPVDQKKKKAPIIPKRPKPGVFTIGDRRIALTERDQSVEASSTERRDEKNPVIMSGKDTNRQSSLEETTVAVGLKEQPDVGMAGQVNNIAPVSSEPTGTVQRQEKKCINKVKVTHVRLPYRGRGSGCRGDGSVLVGKTPGSDQGSSETDDSTPSSAELDLDYTPDPLHKLLTDTFDTLNITTFSVHLAKPSDLSVDAESVREQIVGGMKPLLPSWSPSHSSSSSLHSTNSQSSKHSSSPHSSSDKPGSVGSNELDDDNSKSSTDVTSPEDRKRPPLSQSPAATSYSSLPLSPSSTSLALPSSTAAPSSLTDLISSSPLSLSLPSPSSLSSLSPSPTSSSLSSSDKSGLVGSNEPNVDNSRSTTITSPEDRKVPPSGKGEVPLFRRTPAKDGYIRRMHSGSFQNKTRLNSRDPHRSTLPLNFIPKRETEPRHTPTTELSSSSFSSASEESSSVEINAPLRNTTGDKNGATTPVSTAVENQKKLPTERGRIPVRRLPPKGVYLRHPNFGPLQNRTRSNLRRLPPPSQPLHPASGTRRELISSTELPATSSAPVSIESFPGVDAGPIVAENEDRVERRLSLTSMSTEFNQTLRGSGVPSSHRPTTKIGFFRRPYGGRFQNKTRTNLRLPQHPYRGPMRKPFPTRNLNGGDSIPVESRFSPMEKGRTPKIPDKQIGEQAAPMPTQGVQIKQSGEQDNVIPSAKLDDHDTVVSLDTAEVIPSVRMNGNDTTVRPQTNKLEGRDNAPVQTTSSLVSKESYPAVAGPIEAENNGRVGTKMSSTSMSTEFNQTFRGSGVPSSHRPTTKVGFFRRPLGGSFQNKTRTNLRPSQHPHRGPLRKPFPTTHLNGGSGIPVGSRISQIKKDSTPEILDKQLREQAAPMPTQEVQVKQSGKEDNAEVIPTVEMNGHDTTVRPQTNKLEGRDNAPDQTTSSPVSKESYPAVAEPVEAENEDRVGTIMSSTSMSTEFNQTLRGSGVPSSHRPAAKVGFFRRPYGGRFQNKTRANLRPSQHPHSGPMRKPFPTTDLNGGSGIPVGSRISQMKKDSTPEILDKQLGEQAAPKPTQGVQIRQSGEQDNAEVIRSVEMDGHDTTVRPQTNKLGGRDSALVQTTSSPISEESYPAVAGPIEAENKDKGRARMSTNFNQTLRGSGVSSSHRQTTKISNLRRQQLYGGPFQNKTGTSLRPPQHPYSGTRRKPFLNRIINGGNGIPAGSRISQKEKHNTFEIPDNQPGEQAVPMPNQGVQIRQGEHPVQISHMDGHDTTINAQIDKLQGQDTDQVQTSNSREKETSIPNLNSALHNERVNAGKNVGATSQNRPIKQTYSDSRHGALRPVTLPQIQPPTRTTSPHHTNILFDSKPEQTRSAGSKPQMGASSPGVTRESLDYVGVTNRTSDGFTLIWDSPEDKYKNFVVTSKGTGKDEGSKPKESKKSQEEEREDSKKQGGYREEEVRHPPNKESENGSSEDENRVPESVSIQAPPIKSSTKAKTAAGSDKTLKTILPGSARSFQFEHLPPQKQYTVTLLGKGPGLLSRLHKLVISTGPEPPTDIVFSEVTDNSLTVSWTKPTSPISGFKVTYTHTDEGEPVSVSVDSDDSTLGLSQLSPGSSYEVNVISILGLDESDPIKDFVMTLPDPPTDLRAVNVTDTKALLLWRPALAAVDKYAIVYGSGTDSELKITVSGNAAEQELSGLEGSTTYTVTITSLLGSKESSAASSSFTTTGGSGRGGEGPRDLQANNVTPRTALLSWKPPPSPASSYRLTYQTEGQEMKEVIVDASVTEYNLTRLHPGSKYTVQLQAEGGGRYTAAISTDFTTGTLRFPFPTDCSQELLNGIRTSGEVEIFPQGKLGTPMMVYCDMETDGGGWTVFQRRMDGSENFFRGWKDYIKGFGSLSGEFWLGLESLYNLTAMTRMSLRVDLRDKDDAVFAKYSTFELVKRNYKLSVGGYSGTAGDSLSYHNQRIFSTKDRDLAPFITRCAMSYRGGWWYKNCHEANLNGLYGTNENHQGVIWTSWKGKEFSIPFTEMKMRPAAFRG